MSTDLAETFSIACSWISGVSPLLQKVSHIYLVADKQESILNILLFSTGASEIYIL